MLDFVFPRSCFGCQKELPSNEESFICGKCFEKITLNRGIQCHICGRRNDDGACLLNCRSKTFLRAIFSAGYYDDPILKEAIRAFKYDSIESLKKPLSKLLAKYIENENLAGRLSGAVLVPIPLAFRRKTIRGYNQSELLAEEISPILNCQVLNLIKRRKFNRPQAEIADWESRKENISGVFSARGACLPARQGSAPNKVILVDDVSTSGATLEEVASVLKKAGVKEIYGLVVAKG